MKPIKGRFSQTYFRGLRGLIAGDTDITKIDGVNGRLWFRGYSVEELAQHSTFDEVSYLIIHGELPAAPQLTSWMDEIGRWHEPPIESKAVLNSLPPDTHALMLYRTMLAVAACRVPEGDNWRFDAQWRRPPIVYAWNSTLASTTICHILNRDLNPFNPGLSYSENFLKRSLGRDFSESEIKAFDVSMIVQADHGFQSAALAALTTISTGADLGSSVLAAMGAMSGKLQGGAIQQTFLNILDLKSVEEAKTWVSRKLDEGYRFPGFGHRIYQTHDPRTKILEPYTQKLLEDKGLGVLWDIYCVIKDGVESELGNKGVYVNVYGVTGLIYHALGLPVGSFPIIFALSIQTGWMAHCLEYLSEGKMIEPGAIYRGSKLNASHHTT